MLRKLCAVAVILFLFVAVVSAAEPPPEVPAAEVVEGSAPWWLDIAETALNYLWKLIVPLGFAWIVKKVHDKEALKAAIRALEAGVNDAWVHFVSDLKKKAEDGKLTAAEKVDARTWAKNKAMEIATGSGKRVLVSLGQLGLNALIEKIVRRNKSEAK